MQVTRMILGFRREEDETFVLLDYYAAGNDNLIPKSGTTYRSHFQGSVPEDKNDKLSRTVT